MTNEMIPAGFAAPSKVFASAPKGDELAAGIQASFAILSYRGKVWATKYQGNEVQLMRDPPEQKEPRGSVEVIIIKASPHIAKIYYESGYVPGSTDPPDCWSTNGVTPDMASSKKQSATCAGCKWNAFGSKITEQGKAAKACADSKRLAVVPLNDPMNELMGGPMLLRVPAASLKDVKGYGDALNSHGFQYFAVGTRIGFDVAEAFPKFVMSAIRPLTDDEANMVLELQSDPRTKRILDEAVEIVKHEPTEDVPKSPFEQPKKAEATVTVPVVGEALGTPVEGTAKRKPRASKHTAPEATAPVQTAPKEETRADRLRRELAEAEAAEKAPPVPETPAQRLRRELAAAEAAEAGASKGNGAEPELPKALDRRAEAGAPDKFEAELDALLPVK